MMVPPTIAIVGYSNSGKTRVAATLVRILSERGYRIVAVKHCHHGHQIDPSNKDSTRLLAAGATQVIASSPRQITSIRRVDGDLALEQLTALLDTEYDLVVAEGFKNSSVPKVLVLGTEPISPWPAEVIAVVAADPIQSNVPVYTFEEIDKLAEQILSCHAPLGCHLQMKMVIGPPGVNLSNHERRRGVAARHSTGPTLSRLR